MLARRVSGRAAVLAAVAPLVLLWSTPAAAQQPADQATIDQRIKMGKEFLQKQQKPAGWWGTGNKMQEAHGIGYTCLVGVTLIECGVPNTDPNLKKAADLVRSLAQDIDTTYELSLAILFLDRMKAKVDARVIRLLAGRLISAQMPSGGWGYKTHRYPEPSVLGLLKALRTLQNPPAEGPKPDIDKLRLSVSRDMQRLAIWDTSTGTLNADPKDKRSDLHDATTDNSNTHFAMLGLLAANQPEYDIPVERSFALVARRFRTSQGPSGTWSYDFFPRGNNGANQFTCIALLGVAIGHVYCPPEGVKPEADPVIISAFTALSRSVGDPVGDTNNRPKMKDVGGLYFLWAMERIAVLYDIQKLGKKDWYTWGAEILVCAQAANGSWEEDGGFHGQSPIINTCLALLFLKRANLTPGLSKKLVVDTGALTAKVEDKITPKAEEPTPKVEEPLPTSKIEEPTPPKEEPKAQPAPTTKPAPAPEPEPTPPPKKKSPVLWIVLGVLLAAVVGGLAFFMVKKSNQDDDGAAATKKKKKKKPKAESGDAKKPDTKPKVKQDVEVDDDD